MFRKMALPFKKATRRLRDMESMQARFDAMITEMQTNVAANIEDLHRKFTDYTSVNSEMIEEQNHLIEGYASSFAQILQCCQGQSSDMSRLMASASPVLDRMDTWMVTWANNVNQKFDRVLEQDGYNTNRIAASQKQVERLVLEGFDMCRSVTSDAVTVPRGGGGGVGDAERPVLAQPTETALTTEQTGGPDEGPAYRELDPYDDGYDRSRQLDSNDIPGGGGGGGDSPTANYFKGCEDLRRAGLSESKVYKVGSSSELNEADRDFNRRFCDQEANGGGWTVRQTSTRSVRAFVLLFLALLL